MNTGHSNITETAGERFLAVHGAATNLFEAVESRHSVRAYEDRPVPAEVLEDLFGRALRAPSWKNSQPWKYHIVTGERRNRLADLLVKAAQESEPAPDVAWPEAYPAQAKRRMFDLGMRVYGVAGIDRKDRQARDAFMLENFRFFGAPVAVFITTDFATDFFTGMDLGCALQTVLLLARAYGLGCCPQAALGAFPAVVRRELDLAETDKIVCGISIGYPEAGKALNEFHAPRLELSEAAKFYS